MFTETIPSQPFPTMLLSERRMRTLREPTLTTAPTDPARIPESLNRNTASSGYSKSLIPKHRNLPNPGKMQFHVCGAPLSPPFWRRVFQVAPRAKLGQSKSLILNARKIPSRYQMPCWYRIKKAHSQRPSDARHATHIARVLCANRARHVRIDSYHIGDKDTPHPPWNLIAS
jgi:hypothetical protein